MILHRSLYVLGLGTLGALFGVVLAAAACGDSLPVEDSAPDGSVEGTTIGEGGTPPADLDANVAANCAPNRAVSDTDLFVDVAGTDSAGCGTRQQPCTLAAAIARAGGSKNDGGSTSAITINVAPGDYTGDIGLPTNTTIAGGWRVTGDQWVSECDQRLVKLRGSSDRGVVVVDGAANAGLTLVTILHPGAPAPPSASRIGIFAIGAATTLTLDNVAIAAGRGGDGAAGSVGKGGDEVVGTCASGAGTLGPDGTNGLPTDVTFTATGVTAVPGASAQPGFGGGNGGIGTPPERYDGKQCLENAGVCLEQTGCSASAAPGQSGCGGRGGLPGLAGGVGGGSIGVYAWNGAKVVIKGGLISASDGANGGEGGEGGDGSGGTQGAPGANFETGVCVRLSYECTLLLGCEPTMNEHETLQGGGAGGPGAKGGNGGKGGAGGGGPSFAIVEGGEASVSVETAAETKLTHGLGGTSPGGQPGLAGPRWP